MADEKIDHNKIEDNDLLKNRWMVRDCDIYEGEYSDCTSFKARFNQYFIHGETTDCNSWKVDNKNCLKWLVDKDMNAYKELIASEELRRETRLRGHYDNNTWKKRIGPPPEWNNALPSWLEEQNKGSFLSLKADELRNTGLIKEGDRSLCVIS